MARKNIFELIKSTWDISDEAERLYRLFDGETVISSGPINHTLKEFVDTYCFKEWKNRGRYIDVDDYLGALDFDELYKRAESDIEYFITLIEIIYNFYYMAYKKVKEYDKFKVYQNLITLQDNMDIYLDEYNHGIYYFEDKEQAIVTEKDPAVTAAVEVSDPEIVYPIVQYNHYSLKGDVITKKRILLQLASDIEPKRSMLNGINKAFADDIFTLLNNMNLRHNNCDPKSKDYKRYVADMSDETLEEWYDELYQMILLAKLELNHLERKNKITELKEHF